MYRVEAKSPLFVGDDQGVYNLNQWLVDAESKDEAIGKVKHSCWSEACGSVEIWAQEEVGDDA